jgi:branched-chain amino acid transport system ATP-binding protein
VSVTEFLHLDGVCVQFGGLKAVDGVSIKIKRGERRAIIGPNGAGKTTLFNAITGVVTPTAGRILFESRDVTHKPVHVRAKLGMSRTFQITNLFPNLTVSENMQLAVRGLSPRKYSLFGSAALDAVERTKVDRAIMLSRLDRRLDVLVKELSYGEQRQLEMAMTLVSNPKLLLLDEPAAGLSPAERLIVSDIIRSLPRDLTMVLIEHDMDLALALVDWVTCLSNGKLLAEACPAEIRSNSDVQDVYLGKPRLEKTHA